MAPREDDITFLAHDLSQVLWAIQGRARALALQLPEPAAAEVALIAEDAAAAAMLADEPAAIADPAEAIRSAWRQTLDRARALHLPVARCRLRAPQPAPPVAMPASALRRILGNLFANAVAARPADLTVACRVVVRGGYLRLEVCDDGPGIAPHVRARLFAAGVTTGAPAGATGRRGLGLAGSRELARRWGGDLTDEPAASGACFRLTVPLATAGLGAPVADAAEIEPAGLRVLVVDDDPAVRDMLEQLLAAMDHRPVPAADHAAALAAQAAGPCDVALIDLGLPGRSGAELAAELRRRDHALAVVLLTGWGRERELAGADTVCVDLTAVKPIDLPQLRTLLARAARLAAARRAGRPPEEP